MSQSQVVGGTEVPSHRACAHCRSQKVRCIIIDESSEACQRCMRSGRPCVFTPLQKRRQRKRTDTRVAELEREMRAMRAALKNSDQKKGPDPSAGQTQQTAPEGLWFVENSLNAPRIANDTVAPSIAYSAPSQSSVVTGPSQRNAPIGLQRRFVDRPLTDSKDVVDSGMISMATARGLVDTYRNHLYQHYPIVPLPDSTSADELRQTKPTLFLAIIAAAAASVDHELSAMLDQEVLHTYATKTLVHSEKSLELVQALLISAVWYHPPNKFGQLKYYEYIHMATTMALDIGINTRPTAHRSRFGSRDHNVQMHNNDVHPLEDTANPDLSLTPRLSESTPHIPLLESKRTFLACYIVCVGVSMALRRPNMLRANSYVRECIEYLERSPESMPPDRTLVAWARLNMLGEEICTSFCYDDPGGVASISELRTRLMLKDFSTRLDSWYANTSEADMNKILHIMYYAIRLLLYEVALHVDHSPEDFEAPYQMGVIQPTDAEDVPTQALAEAIAETITASHRLLDVFLTIDVESCRALPVFAYVRISYAAFILTKLCLSNASPVSRIGKVIDRSSLRAQHFMDRAIYHVQAVATIQATPKLVTCRVPAIFLALLFKLRQWCLNPAIIEKPRLDQNKVTFSMIQARSPENTTDQETARAKEFEGPRIVEHISSDESSPYTVSEPGVQTSTQPTQTPIVTAADLFGTNVPATNSKSINVPPMLDANMPQTIPYFNQDEQMELDQNFFMYFGDVNNYANTVPDMTDWANVPPDLMNMPDNYAWPRG